MSKDYNYSTRVLSLEYTIKFLNNLLILDEAAITNLFKNREYCNKELRDHESVQVGTNEYLNTADVGMLGILNGLFGTLGGSGDRSNWGPITMIVDDESGTIEKFEKTIYK